MGSNLSMSGPVLCEELLHTYTYIRYSNGSNFVTIAHRPAGKPADDTLYPGIRWLPTGSEDIQPERDLHLCEIQARSSGRGCPYRVGRVHQRFPRFVSADTLKLSQAIDTLKSSDFEREAFLLDLFLLPTPPGQS